MRNFFLLYLPDLLKIVRVFDVDREFMKIEVATPNSYAGYSFASHGGARHFTSTPVLLPGIFGLKQKPKSAIASTQGAEASLILLEYTHRLDFIPVTLSA